MRIRWTPTAASDLEHIRNYLRDHYPNLAQATVRKLYEAIRSLRRFPQRGRMGREEGTRELVCAPLPHIVAYRVREQAIEILHIFHGSQDRH